MGCGRNGQRGEGYAFDPVRKGNNGWAMTAACGNFPWAVFFLAD